MSGKKANDEITAKIIRAIQRYPEKNNSQINCLLAKKQRVGAAVVAAIRASGKAPLIKSEPQKGKSLAEFKMTFDKDTIVPKKIRSAIKELGASWEYESEFVRRAGLTYHDLGNYREMFAENIVTIRRENKRVWAGTVSLASQLREMV